MTTGNNDKIQLQVGVDATEAKKGFEQVNQAARETARVVQEAGEQAGKGVTKIGAGGEQAAQQVDRATKSLIGSVERATAALQAGERGTASYFETLAKQRGVSGDALKPYIDDLRKAEAAQKAASGSLDKMGVSAGQTAQALRQLPAQFTDIVVGLQSGQKPLTVLLQQGGQIKDSFGGAGEAAKALGGYVGGLINPFTLVAGAVVGLGAAFVLGAKEQTEYRKALILTGNSAGVTADQLGTAAAAISKFGTTKGAAADALTLLATTGKVGAESMGKFAETAIALERVGGPAVAETAKAFAALGTAPLAASLKLNESVNFLTASLYQQIKALEEQGRTTEAAKLAQDSFNAAAQEMTKDLAANLDFIQRSWIGIKDAIGGAADAVKNIGRADTLGERAKKIRDEIAALDAQRSSQGYAGLAAGPGDYQRQLEAQLAAIEKQQRADEQIARAKADQAKQVAALVEFEKQSDQFATKQVQTEKELTQARGQYQQLVEAGAISVQQYRDLLQGIRDKGVDKAGESELADLRARIKEARTYTEALRTQGAEAKKLNEGEQAAAKIRQELTGQLDAQTRASRQKALALADELAATLKVRDSTQDTVDGVKKARDEYAKLLDTLDKEGKAIETQAKQQEAANAAFGKGKTAVEAYNLSVLKTQRETFLQGEQVDTAQLALIDKKIAAQNRYVEALKAADYKALNQQADEALRSAQAQNDLYQQELALAGLTRLERDKIIAARQVELKLAKQLAEVDKSDLSEAEKETLRIKYRQAAEIESSAAVNKVIRDDFNRTADEIDRALTDGLMRGFENGKSLAQNLRDTIANLFKTLVLRPVIQAVVQPVSGSLASSLGNLASASGGGSGFVGTLGSLGSLISGGNASIGNLLSPVAGGLGSVMQGAGDWLTGGLGNLSTGPFADIGGWLSTMGNSLGSSTGGAMLGNGLGYATAIYSLSQGKYGQAAGTALGTAIAGPIGAAIGSFVGGYADKLFGGAGTHHGGAGVISDGTNVTDVRNGQAGLTWSYGDSVNAYFNQGVSDALKAVTSGSAGILNTLATTFGNVAGYSVGGYFASDNNRASQGERTIYQNGQVLSTWGGSGLDKDPTKGLQQLTAALAGQVRSTIDAIDIPGWAKHQIDALGASSTLDDIAKVVTQIQATKSALEDLGKAMPQLAGITSDTVESLLKSFGGIDNLKTAAAAYYDAFYTQAEKSALAMGSLSQQLQAVGLAVPASREAYRSLVEAQDLNTDAGRNAYAVLIKLAPAFANLVPAAADAATAVDQTAANLAAAAQKMAEAGQKALADLAGTAGGLQVELLKAQGKADAASALARQQALAKLTTGISAADAEAVTAAYDYNVALQQQIDALNAASAAAQSAAAAEAQHAAAVGNERDGLIGKLLQLQGDTAALRERELAALDPSNRALQMRIYALEDSQAAEAAAQQAAQQASQAAISAAQESARAAEALRSAWQNVADSIFGEVQRIRGLEAGSSPASYASALSDFTIKSAQAKAGDQDAAKLLPALSQTLLTLAEAQATSLLDLQRMRAFAADTLSSTGSALAGQYGLTVPSFDVGTNYVPQDMLAMVHEGEAIVPRAFNPTATPADPGLREELAALRADLRAGQTATTNLQLRVAKLVERWDVDGLPATRVTT